MNTTPPVSLPVWKDVDVLVLGSTTAAVTAALAAAESGRRVAILGDETYFGQDLAGAFQLWPGKMGAGDPLLSAAFSSCEEHPARPAALKRFLEQRVIQAGIPFLFGVRPVGLLRDESGTLRGVVAAARASLFVATCREVVDATLFGLAARLSGAPIGRRPTDSIRWRVLAAGIPSGWPGTAESLVPPYRQVLKDGLKEYAAFELVIGRAELGNDQRSLEHSARARLVDESVWVTADHLLNPGAEVWTGTESAATLLDFDDAQLRTPGGIWMASRLLPVASPQDLTDPGFMAGLGRRVGTLAAQVCPTAQRGSATLHFEAGGSGSGIVSFTEVFLRGNRVEVQMDGLDFPQWDDFDVIVAGGGTGGAPAAIAASRAGARTLCVETAHGLGGVGTLGLISSYWFGNKCGFTSELNGLVSEVDALSRTKNGNVWHPGVKSGIYHKLLNEAGGTAWMGSFVFGVRRNGNRPDGVLVSTPFGSGFVPAKTFVDATGNADLAAAAGATCRLIDERHVAVQGTGISPRVNPSVPNQNSDHTFIEENDPEGITLAHAQAREKYPNDFETMPFINSRERRRIMGDIEISPLDILAERTFPDTIFTARSNFDTHGFIIHPVFMVVPPDHKPLQAHVPLRCMLPKGLEGILVTGLGMSAHRDALPVIRMQADVQNQGYAAGLLAAQAARSGANLREIDIRAFQKILVGHGIITEETAAHEDSFPMNPAAIASAAAGPLDHAKDVAILFAHPEASRDPLLLVAEESPEAETRHTAAMILGLMGCRTAGPLLCVIVHNSSWDEGWNYRGMGQFGPSMSRLDALIIALGRTKDPHAPSAIAGLAEGLTSDPAFSHCRALSLAAASLGSGELTSALQRIIDLPNICGHAFLTVHDMLSDADGDTTSTASRNRSLREIYLARGLFLAGDPNGRGREILETYASDLRGHFARHARAILSGNATDVLDLA